MGVAGGLIAGALGGAGQAVSGLAQNQIDMQNKATLAQQMSDIEQQRQMAIMQAQEQISQGGKQQDIERNIAMAPQVTAAQLAGARAKLAMESEPGVLTQQGLIAAAQPYNLHPGEQHIVGGVTTTNTNPTSADAWIQGAHSQAAAAAAVNTAERRELRVSNELNQLRAMMGKIYTDPNDPKKILEGVPEAAGSIYGDLIQNGMDPTVANAKAADATRAAVQAARKVVAATADSKKPVSFDEAFNIAIEGGRAQLLNPTPAAPATAPAKTPPPVVGSAGVPPVTQPPAVIAVPPAAVAGAIPEPPSGRNYAARAEWQKRWGAAYAAQRQQQQNAIIQSQMNNADQYGQ